MTLCIVCILWAAYSRASNKRIGFIIGAVSFWLALDAGGRGTAMWGIVAIVAMLSMDFFHNRAPTKRVRSFFYVGLIVPALSWVIVNNFQFLSETVPVFQRFASDSERGYDELSSLGIRFLQYEQALSHFIDSPILGQGALSFRALTGTDAIYPHNIVLDVLGDLGLIGLMIFMLLITLGLVACWRIAATGGVPQKICAALFLFSLGLEMSSGYLYWSKMWPWLVLLIQIQPGRRNVLHTPDVVGH
jgi:O-antigen ligase